MKKNGDELAQNCNCHGDISFINRR